MCALCVVLVAPFLNDHLRIPEAVEDFTIEAFVYELAVEGLRIAILPGRSGFNIKVSSAKPCQPFTQYLGGHLGPVSDGVRSQPSSATRGRTYKPQNMAEIICSEFGLPLPIKRVPIYTQSGDSREVNVDKMILKRVDVLPHGLINTKEKFGEKGSAFREYVKWLT